MQPKNTDVSIPSYILISANELYVNNSKRAAYMQLATAGQETL